MKKWMCVCGYIHDGEQVPAACPRCGAAGQRLERMGGDAADLVERARHANALHCRMVDLARNMEKACKNGIDDNLDPNCVAVFRRTLAHSYEIMKLSLTEMQDHIANGKWG